MELATQSSTDSEADRQSTSRQAMAVPHRIVAAVFLVAACACVLAAKVGSKGGVHSVFVTKAGAMSKESIGQTCPTTPEIDGQSVDDLIATSQGLLVLGMPKMRCTLAFRGEADAHGIAHSFHQFTGQFQYQEGISAVWDYLHCKYPDDRQTGMIMHSYVFNDGAFVGQGFVAAEKLRSGAIAASQDGGLRRLRAPQPNAAK